MRKGGMSNCGWQRRLRANRRDYLALKRNGVPFPFIASIVKPVRKLPQFIGFLNEQKEANAREESLVPAWNPVRQ
jgi:hypothetical protein